ncbi:MAG: ABC transporter ATP-binding protein [Microbacterium sp.]|nr:MAG: ABC transporter ATP-binding protein [Microbacterium sp.]
MALLEVEGLCTEFRTRAGVVRAVDGVSFHVDAGETLALVGESGCGKSVTAASIMRLVAAPAGRITAGSIRFDGRDLLKLSEKEMRRVRGRGIGMIFQDPMSSLNPVFTIGQQLIEGIQLHLGLRGSKARARAVEMLDLVGIPAPSSRLDSYPHQLSGGMRQRVMIAMALSCEPSLILADEITTALDVTIQAQILELLKSLARESGTAVLFITHDLGVVADVAARVNVMYGGQIVERATVDELFATPMMPYTWGLLGSVPRLDEARRAKLTPIEGQPPDLRTPPAGCRFAARCRFARDICHSEQPPLVGVGEQGHEARCHGTAPGGWLTARSWRDEYTEERAS